MRKAKGAEPKLNLKQRESLVEILVAGPKPMASKLIYGQENGFAK